MKTQTLAAWTTAATLSLVAGTASAQNAATIIIPDTSVTAAESGPTTGQFTVFLDVNQFVNASTFNVRIDTPVDTGLQIDATDPNYSPRFFPNGTLTVAASGDFLRITGEESEENGAPNAFTASAGLYGMFDVTYSLPEGALGDYDLSLAANESFVFDTNANPIGVDLQNGTLTVLPVPEPASAALLAAGTLLIVRRRRHA